MSSSLPFPGITMSVALYCNLKKCIFQSFKSVDISMFLYICYYVTTALQWSQCLSILDFCSMLTQSVHLKLWKTLLTWSPWAWRPMTIGLVHPGTRRGTFWQIIGSRNTVPPRMFLIVPLGLSHIFFSLNSN